MDTFFGLNGTHPGVDDVKLLTTVYDNGSFAVIRSLLESADIPYIAKDRGAGEVVKIITGIPMFGTDIYVPTVCYEVAVALVFPEAPDDEDLDDEDPDDDGVGMDMDNDYGADED